jgi:hypothetical protein
MMALHPLRGGSNVFPQGVEAEDVGTAWRYESSSEESVEAEKRGGSSDQWLSLS